MKLHGSGLLKKIMIQHNLKRLLFAKQPFLRKGKKMKNHFFWLINNIANLVPYS